MSETQTKLADIQREVCSCCGKQISVEAWKVKNAIAYICGVRLEQVKPDENIFKELMLGDL